MLTNLVRNNGSKFGRILMGLLFFVSGLSILFSDGGPATTAGYFTSLGIPMANIVVWLVILLKVGAGGAIILGKRVIESAAALIIFTLIATLLAHLDFSDSMQMTQALKNFAIIGGLLYLMSFGPNGMNLKKV